MNKKKTEKRKKKRCNCVGEAGFFVDLPLILSFVISSHLVVDFCFLFFNFPARLFYLLSKCADILV